MALSFKEYSSSDQQQLICIIRCQKIGSVSECVDALKTVNRCGSVTLSSANQIVATSDENCDVDRFLVEIEKRLMALSFKAVIEETRFGSLDDSVSVGTVLSDRFSVVPLGTVETQAREDSIYLEYGSIFGSGHHPSTRLAVMALEEVAVGNVFPKEVLDVGCGSGILAFVCNRLGAQRVLGVDICQKSIGIAQENRKHNCLEEQVQFYCGSLSDVEKKFNLIVANISPSVLHELIKDFPQRLSGNAKVILSGLHTGQMNGIVGQMAEVSCNLQSSYADGSWRTLSFNYTGH